MMEQFAERDTARTPVTRKGLACSRSESESLLESASRAFAEAHNLAFKVVPMTTGPEPRIGLGFYPSGRLRDVAVRLAYRPQSGVRAVSRLPVVDASRWGHVREMLLYRMRSEVTLAWPMAMPDFNAFLDRAVEQARRSSR
jgi:hypothetical protein